MRKTWQEQSSKLKESMTELKKDELNGVRVHNPRSSATPHSSTPTRSDPARLLVPISPRQSLSHSLVPETSCPLSKPSQTTTMTTIWTPLTTKNGRALTAMTVLQKWQPLWSLQSTNLLLLKATSPNTFNTLSRRIGTTIMITGMSSQL
ncbi:hypothetical protein CPC08DRAFT_411960 [Agrocybe pediades]|nr:hypothetical protein CPC08DRAFT_411960 [Agrocybe pediades]